MNTFCCTGNIGRDAETRYSKGGAAFCVFPVAVSSGYGDHKKTMWVRCVLFGKRAEGGLVPYLTKGAQVEVSGELSMNEWTAQDGTKKQALELRVNEIGLLGKPAQRQDIPEAGEPYQHSKEDDSVPF